MSPLSWRYADPGNGSRNREWGSARDRFYASARHQSGHGPIVEGVNGSVQMRMQLIIRFDYGHVVPWVRQRDGGLEAIAGPDALILRTPIETRGEDFTTVAEFTVQEGERIPSC